jgi:hypothetical protein
VHCTLVGYNFIFFWNFTKNQMKIDRYWHNNVLLLLEILLKMLIFLHMLLRFAKSAHMTKVFNTIQNGYSKTQNFSMILNLFK